MTNKHSIFKMAAAACCFAGLAACTSDLDPNVDLTTGNRPIVLTGSVQDLVLSRAASNLQGAALASSATAGIFVTTDNIEYATITNGANNQLTVTNGTTLTPAEKMWWGENKSLYFFAYAPYDESYSLGSTVTFAVKDNQAADDDYIASDLLYGTPSTNPVEAPTDESTSVNIKFQHLLSKVSITLVNDETSGIEFNNTTVTLLNVKKQVSLDLKTGAISAVAGESTGSELVITKAAESETANSAVVVPQTITAGQFVRVDNNGSSYFCNLAADQTFDSGKAYAYTITFKSNTISTVECEVTDWTNGTSSDLTDPKKEAQKEYIYYGVGDFVTKDGKLVKKEDATSQSEDIVGVIFATGDELSATDKGDGYTAYVLGLYTLDAAVAQASGATSLTFGVEEPVKTLADLSKDLDGLTHTEYVKNSLTDYTTNYPAFDLSSITDLTNNDDFSSWFIPSFGQMVEILNNLGEANIPTTTSTNIQLYCALPNIKSDNANVKTTDSGENYIGLKGPNFLFGTTPTATNLKSSLLSSTNSTDLFPESASNFVLSSLYGEAGKTCLFTFTTSFSGGSGNVEASELVDSWGFGQGSSENNRNRIACIATKLHLTEEVEVTE